jgi:DNA repair photolyase
LRWDSLMLHGTGPGPDGSATSPAALFERGAVTRTFDTPGFRGITFYETQARSIINKVPPASRMAFRWTINPYRGCSHSCVYCLHGETAILLADGRTKTIATVGVGDEIYGTAMSGDQRRYVKTRVSAHWPSIKPAYRVTLEDGTELVASGDHRFLSDRGWQHVCGRMAGSRLVGTGQFAPPPAESPDYVRGYVCGISHGARPAGGQARQRAASYRRLAAAAAGPLPEAPGDEWCKGFLAGLFDTGPDRGGSVRISTVDPEIFKWAMLSLDRFHFRYSLDELIRRDGLASLRLTGGMRERLRFLHMTAPAVMPSIEGMAVKSDARLRVSSVEPLGADLPMFDITTGTGDFIANGVVSHNCFARNTHTYLDLDAGLDFNSKIVVKVNAPELARKELAAPKWQGEHVAMGTNVDCYQRAEGRYRLMPGIIAALRDAANPFSILTKGTLILRDVDLLLEAAQVTDVGLNVSVGSIDEELWRLVEPGTPSPRRRLDVCATFNDRGLGCGVLMGPVIPFLSDSAAQLAETVRQIGQAGASRVTPIVLHLRPGAREWFAAWLREHYPGLVPAYRKLYGNGSYAPKWYTERIAGQVRELAERHEVGRARPGQARRVTAHRHSAASAEKVRRGAPDRPGPTQLTLL